MICNIYKRKCIGGVSFNDALIMLFVGFLFLLIIVYDDFDLRPNIKLKTCMANMKRIHQAARLAIMEDPNISDLTVEKLVENEYISYVPRCPELTSHDINEGKYIINDKIGQPVDVVCTNNKDSKKSHGSYLSLKAKYLDNK